MTTPPPKPDPNQPPPQVIYVQAPPLSAEQIAQGVNQGIWKHGFQVLYVIGGFFAFFLVCCGAFELFVFANR